MRQPRSPEEIEAIRERILDQALDIISRRGLDALTMRALAARLDMTAPNLYNFFANKDELYLSLVVKGFAMLHQAMTEARDSAREAPQQARAMIEAYVRFGLDHPRYYDIMFTLPTPKHNDYLGTPHEALSEKEYRLSMEIAGMAQAVIEKIMGEESGPDLIQRRLIQAWSLLHGMISLRHSQVVSYVAGNIPGIYEQTIEELMTMVELVLTPPPDN
ncbi:MAG: TetR/AcrR family transcriptional regulator [Desulfosudaceae bacterium]